MASASLQSIKTRIKSVGSTMQITKAMELVASSKLKRARDMALSSRDFGETLREAIASLGSVPCASETVWVRENADAPRLILVVAGDRGLAGGYNSNVFKALSAEGGAEDVYIPVGKRACEWCERRGLNIFSSIGSVAEAGVGDAVRLGERVAQAFAEGKFSSVSILYTRFLSMLSCAPTLERVLPLSIEGDGAEYDPLIDGDAAETLDRIIPTYVGGVINSAILEASASEQSSRRNAMSSANKNAKEIIDTLSISYNRARQAAITQEITEIVSGSEAL